MDVDQNGLARLSKMFSSTGSMKQAATNMMKAMRKVEVSCADWNAISNSMRQCGETLSKSVACKECCDGLKRWSSSQSLDFLAGQDSTTMTPEQEKFIRDNPQMTYRVLGEHMKISHRTVAYYKRLI